MKRVLVTFIHLLFILPGVHASQTYAIKHWQTNQGAKVVFYQAMEVPMLDVRVAFAAGSAYDDRWFGLSALTTELLNQGNAGLSASTMAERLADTGAQYEVNTSRDMAVFGLKTLIEPAALNKAISTFALILNRPDFPDQAFLREKNQQLMAIAQAKESPDEIANQTFFTALYNTHPYAHPILGTQETVKKITLDHVRSFYKQYFVSRNATVVLVGAIDEDLAHQLAEQLTSNLPRGNKARSIPHATPLKDELNIEVQFSSSQTVIRLGQLGIDHHAPDYFPLLVGNYILGGGGLVSQLANEVRQKRGLSYGVYSQIIPMPGLGPFIISLSTKNDQAHQAIDVTRNTLVSFLKTGPSPEELSAAKQYLIGSFPVSLASNASLANLLLKMAFYNLPDDYLEQYTANVQSVSREQIKQAFQKLIIPEHLLQVSVGRS